MRKLSLLAFGIAALGTTSAFAAGSIKGTAKLIGKAPERKEVKMATDPFCAKQGVVKDEDVVVGAGGALKNVVVRIAKGLPGPVPVTGDVGMDQNGCMYRPRVVVAQAGQQVLIKNSDQTMHNVHTYKGPATLFNMAQVQGGPAMKKKFATVGDVVKFKCDVHPWMTGYIVVTDNPYFAVTGDDGSFELKNVPPGKYTVEIWHEKYGSQPQEITVADGKPTDLKAEFKVK